MNQPLYTDLLNASLVLVAQKNNQKKINQHKENIVLRDRIRNEMEALDDKPKGYGALLGWGWVLLVLFGVGSIITIGQGIAALFASEFAIFFETTLIGLALIPPAILGIPLIIAARIKLKKHKKDNEKLMEQIRQEDMVKNQADEAAIAQLEADAVTLQKAATELLAFLPETYRNAEAACFMLLAVKDGRADTLKEAMNLYEEQLHRWKMEKLAANSARMQQIHMEAMQSAMQEIANNQQQIQDQLSTVTALQMADMLKDV